MLKKLFLLSFIVALASCQHKLDYTDKKPDQDDEYFETIQDENQAEQINDETQAKIDEQVEEIEVKDRVFFAYDSSALSEESKKILNVQSQWLNSDKSIKITIEGHCDERGTREYNIALGERRANATKDYLVSKGVNPERISIVSYGKERPAFFGSSPEVMAKNRRAVTVID